MILHTTHLKYLADCRLFVTFNNGVSGEIDLTSRLTGEMFEPLRDKNLFATAYHHPTMRTVAWANGADLAPEFLLELLNAQQQQVA
ncbi:MAG: DUF2442 domain-containing protein [Methylobacter sp.]